MNFFLAVFFTAQVIAASELYVTETERDVNYQSDSELNPVLLGKKPWHEYLPKCWAKDLVDDEAHEVFDKIVQNFLFDHVLTKELYAKILSGDVEDDVDEDEFDDESDENTIKSVAYGF